MKFAIPEISWHNRDPVLSVDFQPKADTNEPLRLATGGTDSHVLVCYKNILLNITLLVIYMLEIGVIICQLYVIIFCNMMLIIKTFIVYLLLGRMFISVMNIYSHYKLVNLRRRKYLSIP